MFRGVLKIMNKGERGIGLIEVLIALVILGIIAIAFLGGLATTSKAVLVADIRTTAESLARSQMEDVKNQAYDKLNVFKEAYRVLKPGGRLLISDIVTDGEIPEDVRASFDAWAGCIAGALEREIYLDTIRKAGFTGVRIVNEHVYTEPDMDERLKGKITSVQVTSTKPCCRG